MTDSYPAGKLFGAPEAVNIASTTGRSPEATGEFRREAPPGYSCENCPVRLFPETTSLPRKDQRRYAATVSSEAPAAAGTCTLCGQKGIYAVWQHPRIPAPSPWDMNFLSWEEVRSVLRLASGEKNSKTRVPAPLQAMTGSYCRGRPRRTSRDPLRGGLEIDATLRRKNPRGLGAVIRGGSGFKRMPSFHRFRRTPRGRERDPHARPRCQCLKKRGPVLMREIRTKRSVKPRPPKILLRDSLGIGQGPRRCRPRRRSCPADEILPS